VYSVVLVVSNCVFCSISSVSFTIYLLTDGQTDCIVEGEVSRLGNSFMQQTWQKTHLKLFPNRLEFYPKKDGQIIRKTGVEVGAGGCLLPRTITSS